MDISALRKRFARLLADDERMSASEIASDKILRDEHNLIRAHVAFLDWLTLESRGDESAAPIDFRLEFTTFYLQYRRCSHYWLEMHPDHEFPRICLMCLHVDHGI